MFDPALLTPQNQAAFVTFVTAGFPSKEDTVDILLGLQAGGAAVSYTHLTLPTKA